jgi:uncharacterized protein YdcH (DUF465 family)
MAEPDLVEMSAEELQEKHQELEERVNELETPRSMSPEEEYELRTIKKRKLAIKDKLSGMQ